MMSPHLWLWMTMFLTMATDKLIIFPQDASLCNITLQAMTWPSLHVCWTITSGWEHTSTETSSSKTKLTWSIDCVEPYGFVFREIFVSFDFCFLVRNSLGFKDWNTIWKYPRVWFIQFILILADTECGQARRGIINKTAMTIMQSLSQPSPGCDPLTLYTARALSNERISEMTLIRCVVSPGVTMSHVSPVCPL